MAGKEAKRAAKIKQLKTKKQYSLSNCGQHHLTETKTRDIQDALLDWYDKNQRILPWREIAKTEADPNIRGYAVWVSEVMLQQTQVATVISYFDNWMKKWPSVDKLASADLEEINKVWAGLGYYSRARRLHEGANIIMKKLNGDIPQNVTELMNLIPGIGLYSASAIASIAFQKRAGVVDGNVIRVLSRMQAIGTNVSQPGVRTYLWELANVLVPEKRPGDFNQALMELGATVCTPANPKCPDCPVNSFCTVYSMVERNSKVNGLDSYLKKNSNLKKVTGPAKDDKVPDIENVADCYLCLPSPIWKNNPQVTAFPCKTETKSARNERVGVVVIQQDDKFLMIQRPETGLLAGLWEFPNLILHGNMSQHAVSSAISQMLTEFGIPSSTFKSRKYIGEVMHIFSHIHATYVVEHLVLDTSLCIKKVQKNLMWLTSKEVSVGAVSTAMKKVLHAVAKPEISSEKKVSSKKRKRALENSKQTSIKSFFS